MTRNALDECGVVIFLRRFQGRGPRVQPLRNVENRRFKEKKISFILLCNVNMLTFGCYCILDDESRYSHI